MYINFYFSSTIDKIVCFKSERKYIKYWIMYKTLILKLKKKNSIKSSENKFKRKKKNTQMGENPLINIYGEIYRYKYNEAFECYLYIYHDVTVKVSSCMMTNIKFKKYNLFLMVIYLNIIFELSTSSKISFNYYTQILIKNFFLDSIYSLRGNTIYFYRLLLSDGKKRKNRQIARGRRLPYK